MFVSIRSRACSGLLVLAAALVSGTGCQKSSGEANGAPSTPVSLSVKAAPKSAKERLVGTWDGVFSMHKDAPVEDFDGPTVDICKSIRMRIIFHESGKLEMSASMTLPELGNQTNDTTGEWSVIAEYGDEVRIRSAEGSSEPEEVTLVFQGHDSFTMTPPNDLKSLGVLRFTKK